MNHQCMIKFLVKGYCRAGFHKVQDIAPWTAKLSIFTNGNRGNTLAESDCHNVTSLTTGPNLTSEILGQLNPICLLM